MIALYPKCRWCLKMLSQMEIQTKMLPKLNIRSKLILIKKNNDYNIVGMFSTHYEGVSFLSDESLRQHVPQIMQFLRKRVSIDPTTKFTKFDSPTCSLTPSMLEGMACNSRRDSRYRLSHQCVRHIPGTEYAPKRISEVKTAKINHDDKEVLGFEW